MISISKDDFVKAIEDVRSAERCSTNLNYFFKENKVDGYLFFPDCSTTVVRLLHKIFGKADQDDWISYFCFELDFGKKWKEGCIRDADGQNIDLHNAEVLYDFLVRNME